MTSIWWIRRDLRLTDNPTLHSALEAGDVVPVFILDPAFPPNLRAYGSLNFSDSAGNEGHLELSRQGDVTIKINDRPKISHALVRVV